MNYTRTALLAVAAVLLPPHPVDAIAGDDGAPRTITLADPDHPLSGTWRVKHNAGTVVCPQMTLPIPAIDPETVRLAVRDGGARLHMTAPSGHMTLRRVDGANWVSKGDGEGQVLHRVTGSDNASLMARMLDGQTTIYEGKRTPAAGMEIHYILGWSRGKPGEILGHLASMHQGCRILRSFEFSRGA